MEPRPWTCAHCGGRLSWTSRSVGCRPCRTVIVIGGQLDVDDALPDAGSLTH